MTCENNYRRHRVTNPISVNTILDAFVDIRVYIREMRLSIIFFCYQRAYLNRGSQYVFVQVLVLELASCLPCVVLIKIVIRVKMSGKPKSTV